jgi:hypothetical protein
VLQRDNDQEVALRQCPVLILCDLLTQSLTYSFTHSRTHALTHSLTHSLAQDDDEEVALEAAEFWLAFCESELGMELLTPVMSRLTPVLMHNMVSKGGRYKHTYTQHGSYVNSVHSLSTHTHRVCMVLRVAASPSQGQYQVDLGCCCLVQQPYFVGCLYADGACCLNGASCVVHVAC